MGTLKKLFKIITVCLFILTLCLGSWGIYYAGDSTENNLEVEILCTNNENHSTALNQIENLVRANYNSDTIIQVGDYISVYNGDTGNLYFIYPIYVNNHCDYIAEVSQEGNAVLTNNTSSITGINNLPAGKYILYIDNGNLYAQNNSETIFMNHQYYSEANEKNEFSKYSYDNKILFYEETFDEVNYKNISAINSVLQIVVSANTSTRSVVTGSDGNNITYKCNITNFVSQGNYGLCWAAASATIINYKTNSSINAVYLADKFHVGYDDGATPSQIQTYLSAYGLSYTTYSSKLQWSQIKSNISSDKPFVICLKRTKPSGSTAGHAITGYGYGCLARDTTSSARTIYAWDSNGYQLSFLDNTATSIITSGNIYNWFNTVY